MARGGMPAALYGHEEPVLTAELNGALYVFGGGGLGDYRRPPVDHGVEDGAGLVIAGIAGAQDAAGESVGEFQNRGVGNLRHGVLLLSWGDACATGATQLMDEWT